MGKTLAEKIWAEHVVTAAAGEPNNKVIAAVSISGPMERLSRQPGRLHAAAVVATAARLSDYLLKNSK